ncbi:MAG: hypothetical protein HQL06_06910 [Nitrospirae bacterium]|nr:hypothetical protein [Nitrospirota bacterium]
MEWIEELPDDCPPEDAIYPQNEKYFRWVDNYPPTERDFFSLRKLYPERKLPSECQARAVSIFSSFDECLKLRKFNYFKTRKIISLLLNEECGLVKNTPSKDNKSHTSWWVAKTFALNNIHFEYEEDNER